MPESSIQSLLDVLNDNRHKSLQEKSLCDPRAIVLLIKRIQSYEALSETRAGLDKPLTRTQRLALGRINRFLSRYRAYPYFERRPSYWWHSWEEVHAGKNRSYELHSILKILDIANLGRISDLKRCVECNKWLFARFPHQRFCSDTCKDHFHKFNEADKKRRRDWARGNYQTRKELELGSRKAAQRKGGKK